MQAPRTLHALFSLPGFIASSRLKGVFGDRFARVVVRRRKELLGARTCGHRCRGRYDQRTVRGRDIGAADWRIYLELERCRGWCPRCHAVFVEQLDWLAKNLRYTQRYALQVGQLCRDMPNKAVAENELSECHRRLPRANSRRRSDPHTPLDLFADTLPERPYARFCGAAARVPHDLDAAAAHRAR